MIGIVLLALLVIAIVCGIVARYVFYKCNYSTKRENETCWENLEINKRINDMWAHPNREK